MKRLALGFSVLFALAIAGCNGGSGGSSSGSNMPERRPDGQVSGVAFDGLIINGDVRVYAWDGERGELLGEGTTDNKGEYSVTLKETPSQPVMIEVTGGRYKEEASGRNVSLREGDALYTLYSYEQGEALDAPITYYTTLATGLAEHKVATGTPVQKAINSANEQIGKLIGLDIREVDPVDVTDADNAAPEITDKHRYGFSTASISHLTAWISEQNGRKVHNPYSSIRFAQAAYSDIRADGKLDGNGADGTVSLGVLPLTQKLYRHRVATNILVMANDERNKTGIEPDAVLSVAQTLSQSNGSLFGDKEPVPLNGVKPTITNVSHSEGDVIAGNLTLQANVVDPSGIDEVALYVDGELQSMRSEEANPSFSFDTKRLDDGVHSFRIKATNLAGGITEKTVELTVANASIEISNLNPSDGSFVRGTATFSATVTDSVGIEEVRFINHEGATFFPDSHENPTHIIDTTQLADGKYEMRLEATNTQGTTVEKKIAFKVDNTKPQASWPLNKGQTLYNTYGFQSSIQENQQLKEAVLYINGDRQKTITSGSELAYDIDTNPFNDGAYTISMVVTDQAGNKITRSADVFINNEPPQVSIASPSGDFVVTEPFNLKVNAYDSVAVETLKVEIGSNTHTVLHDVEERPKSITIDPASLSEGVKSITVKVTNGAGFTASDSTSFDFQHIPPQLSIKTLESEVEYINTPTPPNYRVLGEVWFTIDDHESQNSWTIVDARYSNDQGSGSFPTGDFEFNGSDTFGFTFDCMSRETFTLSVRVKDSNGLVSDRVSASGIGGDGSGVCSQ